MRFWFLALVLCAPLEARPCRARCREQTRLCKNDCSARYARSSRAYFRCQQECDEREYECRSRCG